MAYSEKKNIEAAALLFCTSFGSSLPSVFSPLVIVAAVMIRSSVIAMCVLYPKNEVSECNSVKPDI